MTEWVDEAIKELVEETAHYTKPEAFLMWCDVMSPRCRMRSASVHRAMRKRFLKIQYLPYLDNLQKVQLLFIFSQPVAPSFAKLLQKEGHKIELDRTQRIRSFRSKDGKYVRCAKDRTKNFQGKPFQGTQEINDPSPSGQDPQYDGADSFLEDSTSAYATVSPQDLLSNGPSSSGAHGFFADEQKPVVFDAPETSNFTDFVKEEPMEVFEDERNIRRAPSYEPVPMRWHNNGGHVVYSGSIRRSMSFSENDDTLREPESRVVVPTEDQLAPQMSALKLAEQIESIGLFLNLHDLQSKASQAVQVLEVQDKKICPKKFHRALAAVWGLVDEKKSEACEGESVEVKKFFIQLKIIVIRPLGRELVANSLVYIDKKIKQFEEERNQEVLSMELIKENLESLLELATSN